MSDPTTLEDIMKLVDGQLEIDPSNIGSEALRHVRIFSTLERLYMTARKIY